MNECVVCGRLVDHVGVCDECKRSKPQRLSRKGRKASFALSSAVPTGRRIGVSMRDRIVELTDRGFSAREIAEALGCSSRTVVRVRAMRKDAA